MKQEKVSPLQFKILKEELIIAELEGHNPEVCVELACNTARVNIPKPFEPVEIIIDYGLAEKDFVRGIK